MSAPNRRSQSNESFAIESLETRRLMSVNQPVVQQDGNIVTIIGQAGNDQVELVLGDQSHALSFSGHQYTFDADVVDEFHVAGGYGYNSIKVVGSNADDTVRSHGVRGTIESANYRVETYQFAFTTVVGGEGSDSAELFGSNLDDFAQAYPGWAVTENTDTTSIAEGFEKVRLYGAGGNDSAQLYGSDETDWLGSVGNYVRLVTPTTENRAVGFERVDGFGRGGLDTAMLLGGASDDLFVSTSEYAWLRTPIRKSYTKGFEFVEAQSATGHDEAYFFGDVATADSFNSAAGEAAMTNGINYQHKALGFDFHSATAAGPNDNAVLFGWDASYHLTRSGDTTLLAGTNRNDEAIGFANVSVPNQPVPMSEFDEFLLGVDPYLPQEVIDALVAEHFSVPSADGSANNLGNPTLGQANIPLTRLTGQDPSRELGATNGLPSPRAISNAVFAEDAANDTPDPTGTSDILWQWGQFLDHDITLTAHPDTRAGEPGVSVPIPVPQGDPQFDPFGTGYAEIPFTRSDSVIDEAGQNQQINVLTGFIDGSQVYGSDLATTSSLRSYVGGKLRMSDNNLLPLDEEGNFLAGDERVNEQPGLISMHTLFAREHNRLADELAADNPDWNDEEIFQAARLRNMGYMQSITYNEFIPAWLGIDALSPYRGYKPDVDPSISNEFATASYRFGHSMISGELKRIDENGNTVADGHLSLADAFNNPDIVKESGIETFLMGQASNTAQALDHKVVNEVRNMLFGPPGAGGLDLVSLNVQRGRDHELPSYNDAREALGLGRITSWEDPVFRTGVGEKLSSVYDSIDDVDMWVGGLAEAPAGGSMNGQFFTAVNVAQFEALRDGDRFFYKNVFAGEELRDVQRTRLSTIILRNTTIDTIQSNVFFAEQR